MLDRLKQYLNTVVSPLRRAGLKQGLKAGLAAAICYWLTRKLGFSQGYWAALTSIIVMQSSVGATVSASRDRLIGTVVGAAVGAVFAIFWNQNPLWYLLAVTVAMLLCGALGLKNSANSARLAGVTATILMIVNRTDLPQWRVAIDRFAEIVLGILVGLLVATVVMPGRALRSIRKALVSEFVTMADLLHALLLQQYADGATEQNSRLALRQSLDALINKTTALLEEARYEPRVAADSLERVVLLEARGRSLSAYLTTIEQSHKPGDRGGFLDHLQPEFGRLVEETEAALRFLGECVAKQDFHGTDPFRDLNSTAGVLEGKIDEVRRANVGQNFETSRVLRAYSTLLALRLVDRLVQSTFEEQAKD